MIISATRDEMERMLGRALSRHIGHTTAAYDIDRILSVLEVFTTAASAYGAELINFLKADSRKSRNSTEGKKELEPGYLDGILAMAEAMGVIQAVSQKEARLKRFAATELGRSLLGARATGEEHFYEYYLAKVVIITDADAIFPVLNYFRMPKSESLIEYYLDFSAYLRVERLNWLQAAFPESILLDRVIRHVPWIKVNPGATGKYYSLNLTENTARHHATPRRGWLYRLGMLDKATDQLTMFGKDTLSGLAPSGEFFWLGPPAGVQEMMKISPKKIRSGPYEDEYNFSGGKIEASEEDVANLVNHLARVMTSAYTSAKLVHAAQASLSLPIEYINYRSYTEGKYYSWPDILNRFFHQKKDTFERLSARKGQIGFFKLKNPDNQDG